MFGVSFPEFLVLGTVALLVLGPEKLPGMLRTMGQWIAKVRRLTTEVRNQSGIDEVLRAEGFDGGLNELRSMMRGGAPAPYQSPVRPVQPEPFVSDRSREYPTEGPDAYGALPEDLVALPDAAPEATAERANATPTPSEPGAPAPAGATVNAAPAVVIGSDASRSDAARSDAAGSDAAGSDAAGSDAAGSDAAGVKPNGSDVAAPNSPPTEGTAPPEPNG